MTGNEAAVERVAEAMRCEVDHWLPEMPLGGIRVTISAGGLMAMARVAIATYRNELVDLAQDRRVESAAWQGRAEVAEAQLVEIQKEIAGLHSEVAVAQIAFASLEARASDE